MKRIPLVVGLVLALWAAPAWADEMPDTSQLDCCPADTISDEQYKNLTGIAELTAAMCDLVDAM
jgi:hypothetical protein